MKLRKYQLRCVGCITAEWVDQQSTLVVVPTGAGKTQIFSEIVRQALPLRSMVIVHREELVFQAKERIERIAGITCDIEMAHLKANEEFHERCPCVIASVQTLYRRLEKFDPMEFGILIADEAHHGIAKTWQTVIAHFCQNKDLKVLGVTATPDRGDKLALGKIFETVAFDYEILDAIDDGWLVPVDQQMVHIGSLDFSQVRTTAGDLNGADLAKIMEAEKNLHGMVGSSIEIIGDKSTILFAASVKHAEMACDIFNRHRVGMAEFVSGQTERDHRREILDRFREGKTQVLANCMVATEGFDAPIASVILNGRPTKSRALYAQIAGRALRPLPGLVDGLETPEERRASIAASAKPSALILDFVGNSGRHKLISCADILGGKHSQDIIDSVTETAREGRRVRITDEMEKEKEKRRLELESRRLAEEARKARLIAEVEYRTTSVDPFERYNIQRKPPSSWDKMNGRTLSEKQRKVLREIGVDPDTVSVQVGKQLIGAHFDRSCSSAQARVLQRFGYPIEMSARQASKTIQAIADNGWKKPIEVPRDMETA